MTFRLKRVMCAVLLTVLPTHAVLSAEPAVRLDAKTVAERLLPPDNLRLPPADAVRTASGLRYRIIASGPSNGRSPGRLDSVVVHYRGTLLDGKEFDSSYKRGEPTSFPLNRVIPCWTEGVQTMKPGGKVKLVCPSNLAYGARGVPGLIPADSPLVFEVELLSIGK